MTDDVPGHSGEMISNADRANLHTLTMNLITMRRLLGRKNVGGELVRADPALIRSAINVGRDEVRQVRAMLEGLPNVPKDPWRPSRDKLIVAATEVDGLLDALEEMLHHASG